MDFKIVGKTYIRTYSDELKSWYGQKPGRRGRYPKETKLRVSIDLENETVLENLFVGRWTRPHKELRKFALLKLNMMGIPVSKLIWSQKAGCSCGCSPAFIADVTATYDGKVPMYIGFTFTTPENDKMFADKVLQAFV